MSKIYGSPLFLSGGGTTGNLPPLLENFQIVSDYHCTNINSIGNLPTGTKIKLGSYQGHFLVWRIVQEALCTKAVLDIGENGTSLIGSMVISPNNVSSSNWAAVSWLNAVQPANEWWDHRVAPQPWKEVEPEYINQDGFLYHWSEDEKAVLQNVDWLLNDEDPDDQSTTVFSGKLMIVSTDEATAAWQGERFTSGFSNLFTRTYDDSSAGYDGISPMGTSIQHGNGPMRGSLDTPCGVWAAIGLNPRCIVSNNTDSDGCYTVIEDRLSFGIRASKLPAYQSDDLAGAIWTYSDHLPASPNDGEKLKIQKNDLVSDYLVLSQLPISDNEHQTILNLKESDGKLHPYIYLSDNYNMSGGCLLLRKDIVTTLAFEGSQYLGSNIQTWCENTFPSQLDGTLQEILMSVPVPQISGSVQSKCFLLSHTEYGSDIIAPVGSKLSYFSDNRRRMSTISGVLNSYWTRSPYGGTSLYYVNESGEIMTDPKPDTSGVRPAIVLPPLLKVDFKQNDDGSYNISNSDNPIANTVPSTNIYRCIVWNTTTPLYVRQFPYNNKKQYQTLLSGAVACNIDTPHSGRTLETLSSGAKVKLGKCDNIDLIWVVARESSSNKIRLVLSESSTLALQTREYDHEESGNPVQGRRNNGNNRYKYSNINQWLNSDKPSGSWYQAQHQYDAAPDYANGAGFLYEWSEIEKSALLLERWETTLDRNDGGGTEEFDAYVVLMSTTELGDTLSTGGYPLDIFTSDESRKIGRKYCTRTPYSQSTGGWIQWITQDGEIHRSGDTYSSNQVAMPWVIRPVCSLNSEARLSYDIDEDGCFTIV